jgi:hypothetical protein
VKTAVVAIAAAAALAAWQPVSYEQFRAVVVARDFEVRTLSLKCGRQQRLASVEWNSDTQFTVGTRRSSAADDAFAPGEPVAVRDEVTAAATRLALHVAALDVTPRKKP